VAVGVLVAATVVLASRRDVGDGILATSDVATLRPRGLGSTFGFATRLEAGVLLAWCAGAAATGLVLGIVAELTTQPPPGSMEDLLDQFGARGTFANQFFGIAFLLVATVICLLPAGQLSAAADEEASGRLVHILTRAPSRARWFAGRLALTAIAVVVAALVSGLATWAGAAAQGVDVSIGSLLGAGLNAVPTALLVLGFGALVLAVAPRAAATAVYVVVIWSILVDILASLVSSVDWLGRTSLSHYYALAPAEAVDTTTVVVTLVLATVLAAAGTLLVARRDLHTG
jgi:ABC-2 type transport system permease protein